jgi:PAS domain S-box-containing protein
VNALQIATLSLFSAANLLLLLAGRLTPLPGWLQPACVLMLAAAILGLLAAFRKREELLGARLRSEISGMQQEVAKAARRSKSLLERAANAIFVFNADTVVLEEVNGRGTEIFGYSKEEFASMLGRDLLHESEHEKFRSLVYRLKRHGRVDAEGLTFRRKDGSVFLGEVDARLIELVDEQVVHCVVRDITKKVSTEKEIWQRNHELSILNNILTGLNRGPKLERELEGTLAEILELVQAGAGAIHFLENDGATPVLAAWQGISHPLAQLVSAEIAQGSAPLWEVSVQRELFGAALLAGAAAEGWNFLTAVPLLAQREVIGIMHLMHPSRRDYTSEELRFLGSVGTQMGNVIEQARLFTELNWKSAELLRSHHLLEKSSHSLSLSESKLKQNLALVEQANLELSRLDRMKNKFLGMVSHEFNTPLTSIISGSEHLLQQGLGTEQEQVLEMVRNGGLRLKELVADLLKLIRLEARGGELDPSPLHLKSSLEGLKEQLLPQLAERRQTLRLTDLDALPFFDGDWKYLERVFGELLLNAIQFSPNGGEIEVTGRVVDLEALSARRETLERFNGGFLGRCGDRCYLEVEVRDNGIGVPFEEQQRIFEIFYEVGEIRHHSSGKSRLQGKGAGLGLAIVKGMVEAHGGMVWVESDAGSSFFLVLPLEQEAIQPALF